MFPRHEMLELVVIDGRARGIVARDMVTGQARDPLRRRGGPRHRRLRQRLLPRHLREGLQRHRDLAGVQEGRRLRQPLLHPDPPHLHPRPRRLPEQAHPDERVAPQRRPHLGAEEGGRHPPARPDPRGRARLLPRAQVPELRQPRPPRHLLARGQAGVRRGPRRRADRLRRLPRLRRRHRAPGGGQDRARSTATSSRCTSGSPTRTPTRSRCGSTRPRTTPWAGSGWTTT